jgi:hypothetical protein
MAKLTPKISIEVKAKTSLTIKSDRIEIVRESLREGRPSISIVLQIPGGRSQFICKPEDYSGAVAGRFENNTVHLEFDCFAERKIDSWMRKYQAKAPFSTVLEGFYDNNGDIYRLGELDEDGDPRGIDLGFTSLPTQ